MRLPYLQVTQETWSRAKMLAPLLGINRREAFALICDLWGWAVDQGPDDRAPSGEIVSTRAAIMIAGALEWTGEPTDLVGALEDCGLLARIDGGLRVKGLDRYREAWTRAQASRERKRLWRERNASGTHLSPGQDGDGTGTRRGRDGDGPRKTQTQTQTQTQKKEEVTTYGVSLRENAPLFNLSRQQGTNSPEKSDTHPPATEQVLKARKRTEADPRHAALVTRLCAVFERATGRKYAFEAKHAKAVVRLIALSQSDDEIERAWLASIRRAPAWPGTCDLTVFADRFNEFASFLRSESTTSARNQPVGEVPNEF